MRLCVALLLLASALPAQTVLRGTVRDMAGFPLEGVHVSARMEGTAIVLGRVTPADGKFIFTLLPGAYSVTTDRASDKRHIDVAAGAETVLDLAVPGNATISGRVIDSERQPVKGAYVWLLTSEYIWGFLQYAKQMAYTDANGAYTFSNRLQSKRRYYVLAARPANGRSRPDATSESLASRAPVDTTSPLDISMEDRHPIEVSTYYPSAAQFDAASPIALQPGEQRGGVDIKLTAAHYYCVDGKIRDKAFTIEQPGAVVPNATGRAGGNGGYRFCGLTAGSYRLVTKDGAAEFAVSNADVHGVDLTSPPARLRLESDANTPAPDGHAEEISAKQQFEPNMMLRLASQTAAAAVLIGATGGEIVLRPGAGETDVPGGEYAVIAAAPGGSPVEIWYNGVKLLDPVLRVTQGAAGTLRVEASPSTCALNVTIADGADATAIVVPDYVISAGQLARLAQHGGNDFKLPPGKYRVLATAQTIRWKVPDDLEKLLPEILQGELVDLDGQTPVQITVKPVTIY